MAISTITKACTPINLTNKVNEIIPILNKIDSTADVSLSNINTEGILKIQTTSTIYGLNNVEGGTVLRLQDGANGYSFIVNGDVSITFDRSGLSVAEPQLAFTILLDIRTLGSIIFNNVLWIDGQVPNITETGTYLFAFIRYWGWDRYIGNLQGKVV